MAKKLKKTKRVRYYGIVKPKFAEKVCWLSTQNKNGWSLGFALEKRTIWLRNLRFETKGEVIRALKIKHILIGLKNSKTK